MGWGGARRLSRAARPSCAARCPNSLTYELLCELLLAPAVFDLTAHQLGSRVEMDAFVTVLRDELDLGSWRPATRWAERNEALRRQLFGDAPRGAGTLKSNS